MIDPEPLMTIDQVAKWLACSPDSVRDYVRTEKLPFVRLRDGTKQTLRFSRDAVQRWIDARSGHVEASDRKPEGLAVAAKLWGWDGVVRAKVKKR